MADSRGRVWITGASGMVGKNLCEHPLAQKWSILAPLRSELDLRDTYAVQEYALTTRPDLVIHAAGQVGGIQANVADPFNFLVNNLDIGRNVVTASIKAEIPSLINLASSCMYPRNRVEPLREADIMTGELEPTNEGYAIAKIAITRMCEYVSRIKQGFNYKTIIPCNLYGRYDSFDVSKSHLIAAIISKLDAAMHSGAKEIEVWGDGSARREFMYAADLADAIWRAADDPFQIPNVMNIGIGQDYTVLEYYKAVAAELSWAGEFTFDLSRPIGMQRKLNDITLQTQWGWAPTTGLAEGLRQTIDFYRKQVCEND